MKAERAERWARRKAQADGNHGKCGYVGGNPRYNGKRGGNWIDTRPHKNRTQGGKS